jgi:hypothetical protein
MKDFSEITLREQVSSRGGGIEISLDSFGYQGEKMTAFQNYLGGGMLGSIQNDCTIKNWQSDDALCVVANDLNKYFHSLTNHEDEEWESMEFEEIQSMPKSSY